MGSPLRAPPPPPPPPPPHPSWFPSKKCTKPDQTTLGKFQASLGAGGTDALKPPSEWDPMPKTHLAQRFRVSMTSPEGKRIVDAFHKTSSRQKFTITKLERIQNTAQWQSCKDLDAVTRPHPEPSSLLTCSS